MQTRVDAPGIVPQPTRLQTCDALATLCALDGDMQAGRQPALNFHVSLPNDLLPAQHRSGARLSRT
jgi:hypothetical protein